MEDLLTKYITEFSQPQDEVLTWLNKQTHLRTNHSRMLCGAVEGKLLEFISKMISPLNILEIGTFTGYSAICLARGLKEGGHLDTLDINDELEDLIKEGFERSNLADKIQLYIGDAKDTLVELKNRNKTYDLVFIDANKREYSEYYNLVFDMVVPGGYILADNVLWDKKILGDNISKDAQTQGIYNFNKMVREDKRVENIIIPIRDGLNLIRKL